MLFRSFNRALALDQNDIRALFNRGCACHQMGHGTAALQDLNQVLSLDPHHIRAYLKRGLLRRSLGDERGALADLHQAADCARVQGQPYLYHHILTLMNAWQQPVVALG